MNETASIMQTHPWHRLAPLAIAILLASCAATTPPVAKAPEPVAIATQPAVTPKTEFDERYDRAVKDASNPEPQEISKKLIAIRPDNHHLVWKNIEGTPHVLMATLTASPQFYSGSLHGSYDTGKYDIWVTAVPEVKKLCSAQGFGNDLLMRLRQLLGLTPTAQKTHFIEFYVIPKDMLRPAPDNEITDSTAGLNLPAKTEPGYRQWFNDLRAESYFKSEQPKHDAYPWTQLGYTYDWGNPDSEVGVSEFVIKKNSKVTVENIAPLEEYCRRSE